MQAFWNIFLGEHILPDLDFPPQQILDIGCGSGIYCIEVAFDYPDAQVHGVDISPVNSFPVPGNCNFYVADVMEGLWFHDGTFDFIHSRELHSGILEDKWVDYLCEVFRLLKPGGWVQLVEMDPWPICDDGTLPMDSAWIAYLFAIKQILDARKVKVFGLGRELRGYVEKAGFMNIIEKHIKCPLGKWTKSIPSGNNSYDIDRTQRRLGDIIKKVWRTTADSALPQLKDHLGNEAEAIRICEQTKREQASGDIHTYFYTYVSFSVELIKEL